MELRGKWVWITGASSGLGKEMARLLAREHGANLVLTARRATLLEELKAELEAGFKVQVVVLPGDLGSTEDVERLSVEVVKHPLSAAVLNAGITYFGRHVDLDWKETERIVQVNVLATTRLASDLLKHFRGTDAEARIMLVSSMTGVQPVPYQAAYSGSKAFLVAFGTALAHELEGTRQSVAVFAPGGIATEQTAGEKFTELTGWLAPVEDVAREAVDTLRVGHKLRAGGFVNRLGMFVFRFLPRMFVMGRVGAVYRKALEAHDARAVKPAGVEQPRTP